MEFDELPDPENEPFWGHIGIKLDGFSKSEWFPVTEVAVETLRLELEMADSNSWLMFVTRINKIVTFRTSAIQKITFLEDGWDGPADDWTPPVSYEGFSSEVAKHFGWIQDSILKIAGWQDSIKLAPNPTDDPVIQGNKNAEWTKFIHKICSLSDRSESPTFISECVRSLIDAKLYDEDIFYDVMHDTTIYLTSGSRDTLWAEDVDLRNFFDAIQVQLLPSTFRFQNFTNGVETHYFRDKISAVSLPILDVYSAGRAVKLPCVVV